MGRKSAKAAAAWRRRTAFSSLLALAVAVGGILIRGRDATRLAEWTQQQAMVNVETTTPQVGGAERELVLPGDMQPLFDARIRARVSGYIRDWKYDIGAHVKAGDVLATIDAPDLESQLQQAKNEVTRADAELALAKLTSKRWSALRASTAVSQQSVDEKSGDYAAKSAAAAAARSNFDRLKALQGFTQIVAPFSGVVTARSVDIGVLVSPDRAQEMFRVADIHRIRIYVSTPQSFSAEIVNGLTANSKTAAIPQPRVRGESGDDVEVDTEKSRSLLSSCRSTIRTASCCPAPMSKRISNCRRAPASSPCPPPRSF